MSVRGFFCSSCEQDFLGREAKDAQKSRYGRILSCDCPHCGKRLEIPKIRIMKYLLYFFSLACGAAIFMLGLEQLSGNKTAIILWTIFYLFCLYWSMDWLMKYIGAKFKGFGKGFGSYVIMVKAPGHDLNGDLAEKREDIKP